MPLDDILAAIAKNKKAIDPDRLHARLGAGPMMQPKPAPKEPDFLRGLESIGHYLTPNKPVGSKTLRRLIREHNLPAAKVYGIGWIAKVERLKAWLEEMVEKAALY